VLLVATGLSVPNQVDFPGSEYADGYESVSVDPKDFVGQNVLILGRGNSAFETAENIFSVTNFIHMLSRSRVRLSWATHYVGDLRAINNGLLDTYQLKSLDGLLESDLTDLAIVKDHQGKFHITLKLFMEAGNQSSDAIPLPQDDNDNFAMRVAYDRVIRCLGWKFDFSIFSKSLRLSSGSELSKKYPLVRASYESKGSRGLFILGTASHSVDYRKSAGGFIHGFRYTENLYDPPLKASSQSHAHEDVPGAELMGTLRPPRVRAVHRLLEQRHHGVAWPSTEHPITHLASAIIRRINEASGLYQMFSVLADVVLLKDSQPISFYFCAESCFLFALTHQKLPPFCQQGYLRTQGLVGTESLRQHGVESGLLWDSAIMGQRQGASEQQPGDRGPGGHPLAPGPPVSPFNSNKEEL
ncbi:FOXRED2, partial [Cervus elaphus hippelaphus]